MPQTAIASDLHKSSDVAVNFSSEISLDLVVAVQNLAEMCNLGLGKIPNFLSGVNTRLLYELVDIVLTNAVQHGQGVNNCLVTWEVDTCNSCHALNLFLWS